MAKKKTNTTQQLSPERYIRTKARSLPIYKCYVGDNEGNTREKAVLVIRQHAGGTFTYGGYLLDCWCVGVKDSFWDFSVPAFHLEEMLERFRKHMDLREVSYVEAHNWVYGAADWATNAGIEPCKDFALTQYILQPDDDEVELIEYEFGKDGEYVLEAKDQQEANKYIPALKRTLGEGNYKVIISPLYDEPEEEEDDDEITEEEILERMDKALERLKNRPPDMEYTYKGANYPSEITLHHPQIADILQQDTRDISDKEMKTVLAYPQETLREDLHSLILQELGKQYSAPKEQLQEDDTLNWWIIGNALMCLCDVATREVSLPVVLEVLRQNEDVLYYNLGDMSDLLIVPVLWNLCKDDPMVLTPYLLEEGLSPWGKNDVIVALQTIGEHYAKSRPAVIDVFRTLYEAYTKDLPQRKICDGNIVGMLSVAAVSLGAKELLPLIEEAYATGLVDEDVCGDIASIQSDILHPRNMTKEPPHTTMEILNAYRHAMSK
ncbi:MAG: hypothetical protein IJ920_03655 [Paludibacteraceae bacterium]|nr:hypothetical protein [Paludibacteraceae bacterium]MBR4564327.1 hypothetical protein [Paludibacteraceae bacterium]